MPGMWAQVADISCAWADIGCPASRTGIPGAGPDIIIRHQYADMNVGQAQIISKNIPGAGRLPPCGSRHGQTGIPTPRSMSGGGPGCSCPREQGQALPSKPRACQSRCQALARAAPVRRCLVPSRAARPIERPVGRRVRRGVARHACQAALQVACRPTYPMSGGVAGAVQPSLPRPLWGHSSLLLPIRVSPCNLALPVYKGGQGLLCEGRLRIGRSNHSPQLGFIFYL